MKQTQLQVDGMSCSSCAENIEKALTLLPGVESAHVEFEKRQATVQYDDARIEPRQIVEVVNHAGYQARPLEQSGLH